MHRDTVSYYFQHAEKKRKIQKKKSVVALGVH